MKKDLCISEAVHSKMITIPERSDPIEIDSSFGGLAIYKNSHKHGFFDHSLEHPKLGKKSWTKNYTHIDPEIVKKFERIELEVEAGSAVLAINSLVHSGYQMKKKGHARITITERYNPLKKIPYLKDEKAPLKIPYVFDYDQLVD